MLSTSGEVFTEFGPSAFFPRRSAAMMLGVSRDRRALRSELRAACPAAPGVYGMIDHSGRLIYVGVSCKLRHRLLTYFQGADKFAKVPRRDDDRRKELRIARRAVRLVWEVAGHELLALLREHELIRRFLPDLNVRGRRRRRLAYIVLSADEAPRFRVAAQLPKSSRHHWGPFPHNGRLLRAVELLNRQFKLPDCPSQTAVRFAGDGSLFPIVDRPLCLRGEVDRCLAPCVGATTRHDYFAQLARVRAFLDGRDDAPLVELDRGIAAAVEHRNFEQAARLHEIRSDLETLRDRLLPQPHEEPRSFVYPIARGRRATWVLVHASHVVAVRNEPTTAAAAERWLERLDALPGGADLTLEDRDAGASRIVEAWFRQHPTELERVLGFDAAREFCRQIPTETNIRVTSSHRAAPKLHLHGRYDPYSSPSEHPAMTQNNHESRGSNNSIENQAPDYRANYAPRAETNTEPRDCHAVKPKAAPSSAAENHDDANQKCDVPQPLSASKDQHERATG